MEKIIGVNIKTVTYWIHFAVIGFLIFMVCYYGFITAVKILVPLILIFMLSYVIDFPKSLVFAVIGSSVVSLTLLKYYMFMDYWFRLSLADVIVLIQFLLLIMYSTVKIRAPKGKDIFVQPMILFLVGIIVSFVVAEDRSAVLAMCLLFVIGYFFYRYILLTFSTEKGLHYIVIAFVGALVLAIIFAFVGRSVIPTGARTSIFRAGYVFAGPNGLAAMLAILLPFTFIALALRNAIIKITLALFFALGIFLLSITFSRNGYISFITSTIVIVIMLLQMRFKNVLLISTVIIGAVVLLGTVVLNRLVSIALFKFDPSALFRFILWQTAMNQFLKSPFTGIGIGNFYYVSELYRIGFCHNFYLNLLVEMGIFGGASVLWLLGLVFYRLIKTYRSLEQGFMKTLNVCLLGSWVAFSVNNMFDQIWFFFDRTDEMKFFWLLLATTAIFITVNTKQKQMPAFNLQR